MKKITLEIDEVRFIIVDKLLKNTSINSKQAKMIAQQLIYAEASGKYTHGLIRVCWFINKNIQNHIPAKLTKHGLYDFFDCSSSIGYLAAEEICDYVSNQNQSISIALAANIFPTGVLNYYIKKYCRDDLFFIFGTTPKLVTYDTLANKITGSNPIAFGCSFEKEYVVMDITTSKTSFGELLLATKGATEFVSSNYLDDKGKTPNHFSDLFENSTGDFTGSIFQPLIEKIDYKLYSINIIIELLTMLFLGQRGDKGDTVFIKISKDLFGGVQKVNDLILDLKNSMNLDELPGQHSHNLYLDNVQKKLINVDYKIWNEIVNL